MQPDSETGDKVIVLGGSAGALPALLTILERVNHHIPAPICIVLHLGTGDGEALLERFRDVSALPCTFCIEGESLLPGHVYLCPPDRHLLTPNRHVHLTSSPRVNRARPAIDLTLRSIAVTYQGGAIGVVLSGMLDDGTAGMFAVQRCGGVTIVQDPQEALYPAMPQSVLLAMSTTYTLPAGEIGAILNQLASTPVRPSTEVPREIRLEHEFDLDSADDLASMHHLGAPAPLGCPECGGPLWEISHKEPVRYRCHVGHSMTIRSLLSEQDRQVEMALWSALRVMEEHVRTQERLSRWEAAAGRKASADIFKDRAQESQCQAQRLRSLLETLKSPLPHTDGQNRVSNGDGL